ncbi:hypothetical protein Pdca_61370 [Pseudonocardia autotrophica]|nr:hypothetical protein Pdca_61370 [Pseudonocardia autotrophica]
MVVAAVLVAGLAVVAGVAAGRCSAGGNPEAVAGAESGADTSSARQLTARAESDAIAGPAAAGIPATPRWGLWSGIRGPDGTALPEITGTAATGDRIVTVQLGADERQLLAGYAAADGTPLWAATLPRGRYSPEVLLTGDSVLVHGGGEVSAFDPASGELRWCTAVSGDARVSVLDTGRGALVAEQDADRSRLRLLDRATGEQHWSRDYRVHDGGVAPVVAGDVVTVFAVGEDRSGVQAFRLGTGEPGWSLTDDLPRPFGVAGGVLLVRSGTGLHGVEPGSGALLWSSERFDPHLRPGVAVRSPGRPGDPALLLQPSEPGGVTAFDPATGALRWELPGELVRPTLRDGVQRADTVGDRLLLQGRRTGLVAADPATGRITGRAGDASPMTHGPGLAVVTGPGRTTVLTWDD